MAIGRRDFEGGNEEPRGSQGFDSERGGDAEESSRSGINREAFLEEPEYFSLDLLFPSKKFAGGGMDISRELRLRQVAAREELERSLESVTVSEYVERKLERKVEVDETGFLRTVYYAAGGKSFVFKGREELPIYPALLAHYPAVTAERPTIIPEGRVLEYLKTIEERAHGEGAHKLANRTPIGVLEVAHFLGGDRELLGDMADIQYRQEYSDKVLALIDAVIAAAFVDETGEDFAKAPNPDAEALMALALAGDEGAQIIVRRKAAALREIDRRILLDRLREIERYREGRQADDHIEPLKLDELVCVHASPVEPITVANGEYAIIHKFDSTRGQMPRNSVHVALNHKVAGHIYGSWDSAPYAVIAPLAEMIKANGKPTVLNTVDTNWNLNPGEPLEFRGGILVMPGGETIEGLYRRQGQCVEYRSAGFTGDEWVQLMDCFQSEVAGRCGKTCDDEDRKRVYRDVTRDLAYTMSTAVLGGLGGMSGELQEKAERMLSRDSLFAALRQYIFGNPETDAGEAVIDRITELWSAGGSAEDLAERLINESKAIEASIREGNNPLEVQRFLIGRIAESINASLSGVANEIAVNETIKELGFKVQPGGMWSWGGSWEATAAAHALADRLGTVCTAHCTTPGFNLLDSWRHVVAEAFVEGEFDWTKFDFAVRKIREFDPKTRRVIYATGLTAFREV